MDSDYYEPEPCKLCERIPVNGRGPCEFLDIGNRMHRFYVNHPRRKSACGKVRRP